MLEASRLAQQYLAGIDKAEFFASRMIQQAVLMNIVIIGETATQIRAPNIFSRLGLSNKTAPSRML
jgi:uncharacterized protein with HEPN domain